MPYSYATVNTFKDLGKVSGITEDPRRRSVLESASRQIDAFVRRTFRTYLATLYFTAQGPRSLLLDEEQLGLGLLSVTTLKTDGDQDRTYGTTWAVTDYDLEPFNAPTQERPYWEVTKAPQGNNNFPRVVRGVEIVGKWGFNEELVRSPSLVDGSLDSSQVTFEVDDGEDFEELQTVLIDSEQMYISQIDKSTTLTVERGVNGTTAASHLDDAVIDIYRYPSDLAEATLMHASRLWTRRAGGFSNEIGYTDSGVVRPWVGMDLDVQEKLQDYRLYE